MSHEKKVRICFRFDDPNGNSDHLLERNVLEVFRRFGFPITVAVVPFSHTGEHYLELGRGEVPHLSEAQADGRIEVALHGYQHKALSHDSSGVPSEFKGIDRVRQEVMIRTGKAVLEAVFDTPLRGFIPPWNTYDETTLEIASNLNFSYLSCGVSRAEKNSSILTIAKTCALTMHDTRVALASAKRHLHSEPIIVFVFHPDNFLEFRYPPGPKERPAYLSLPKLKEILTLVAGESGWATVCTLSDLSNNLKLEPILWTSVEFNFLQKASWRIRKRFPMGFMSNRSKFNTVINAMKSDQSSGSDISHVNGQSNGKLTDIPP